MYSSSSVQSDCIFNLERAWFVSGSSTCKWTKQIYSVNHDMEKQRYYLHVVAVGLCPILSVQVANP